MDSSFGRFRRSPIQFGRRRVVVFALAILLLTPAAAWAGMPSIRLSDVVRMRLQSISFFLVGFLVSAVLVQLLWNRLIRSSTTWPRLSFGRALGIVALWGLVFVLVLTMISGARELLTPGAWQKDGLTYRLKKPSTDGTDERNAEDEMRSRRFQLENLRDALWDHARQHDGKFPPSATDPAIGPALWTVPHAYGATYAYFGGQRSARGEKLLAVEPEVLPGERWALFNTGTIRRLSAKQIDEILSAEGR